MVTAVRSELYVDAARVSGLSDLRIIGRHVLSVVRAPIIIQTAIVAIIAIAIQSGLEFLGLGDTVGAHLGWRCCRTRSRRSTWPHCSCCGRRSRSALTSIALMLLANAMRDVLERTVVVRRKRRRAVTTAHRFGRRGHDRHQRRPISVDDARTSSPPTGEPIRHDDDEQAAVRSAEVVLSVKDLRVGYGQDDGSTTEVVHGVSLDIRKGEVHGLIGESGSGKSQTAFAVLGLLPKGGSVTGGSIDYEGTRLENGNEAVYSGIRGRRIGYIPQEPMSNLDQSFTIGSQLIEPLRVDARAEQEGGPRQGALAARAGRHPATRVRTFKAYPFEVSGGMAQRVLIAGAVSTDPDLIIADEPTTALDVTVQAEVLDLLRDLQAERHMAMLLVTHNFGVVADLCDRVTVMQSGLFVETGPVRAIFQRPEHPYTKSLLASILDEGPARPPLALAGTATQGGIA